MSNDFFELLDVFRQIDDVFEESKDNNIERMDDYDMARVSEESRDFAKKYVKLLPILPDDIFPSPSGQVSFEWYGPEIEMYLDFEKNGNVTYHIFPENKVPVYGETDFDSFLLIMKEHLNA